MLLLLDPWLRRTLERQVTKASGGYYQLQVEDLRTSLWSRSITLRGLQLRSSDLTTHERLPRLRADVGLIRLQGIGLLALLRRDVVPLDTVLVQRMQLGVGKMPPSPPDSAKALHEKLPLNLKGLQVGYLSLRNLGGNYTPEQQLVASLRRADLEAHDILISAAGAADTQRLGYARRLAFQLADGSVWAKQHAGSFRAIRFSTNQQRLELDSVRVRPVGRNKQAATTPRLTLALTQLRMTGLRAPQLARQQFRADSLLLTAPHLTFVAAKSAAKTGALHQQLAPWLRRSVLRYIGVSGGQLQLPGLSEAPTFRAIEVSGHDLVLDSVSAQDKARIYYARAWQVRTGPATAVVEAPFYRARYEKLSLDTRTGAAQADNLTLTPTMGPAEFARRKRQSVSRLTVQIPQLRLAGLNYAALARSGALIAKVLELRNPRLQVTSDANYPQPARQSTVSPEQIGKLPFRVDIDVTRIINFNFRSAEISQGASVPGIFAITRFNANITNLTNRPGSPPTIGRVSGWLEDKCLMEGVFRFNLRDPQGSHSYEGTFGAAPFAILNPVSEPAAFIRFERGQVQRIACKLQFSRQGARGMVWARYSDLKVSWLKKNPGPDKKNILTRIGSLATNKLIVRDNNPRRAGQALQAGQVDVDRDLRYSVFRVWRVAVVDGVLSSFGVPEAIADKVE
jgi:hypothetical protein